MITKIRNSIINNTPYFEFEILRVLFVTSIIPISYAIYTDLINNLHSNAFITAFIVFVLAVLIFIPVNEGLKRMSSKIEEREDIEFQNTHFSAECDNDFDVDEIDNLNDV